MSSIRSRTIHGILSRLSSSLFSEKKSLRFYSSTIASSSSSSSSSSSAGLSNFYISCKRESPIYQISRREFRRPPTVSRSQMSHWNSVSFIGSVVFPVKKLCNGRYTGVWTVLEVEYPGKSKSSFRIVLNMKGKMAEISSRHMMQNDFIYVSGHLDSYTKVDSSGRRMLYYKVIVKEFNYVKRKNQHQTFQIPESLKLKAVPISSALDNKKEDTDRIHLWQIFFANPHEWWDNRRNKPYPRCPDFKHKDTGECLWIMPNDPPWVAKQLQLIDSKMTERYIGSARARFSQWEYED